MARIYISYSHADIELVDIIASKLRLLGHEIVTDNTVMKAGQDWRKSLLTALKNADGVLVLITDHSIESKYVISEIGTARAFIDENENKKFLIPLVYGEIPIPNFIGDLYCIKTNDNDFEKAVNEVDQAILSFNGKKQAIEERESQKRQLIENKAGDFIKEATTALGKRERHNRGVAYTCYILGLLTLIGAAFWGEEGLKSINDLQALLDKHPNQIWGLYTIAIIKSVVLIGLFIACSKYTFTLGKSFMHEALRNADRIHAISFGEFYLKAFGDKIDSPNDIKEVFQHWNIDKSSSFLNLDANSYDPKLIENLVEISKNLSKVKEDKK